jgi:hypothetical protein
MKKKEKRSTQTEKSAAVVIENAGRVEQDV